MSAEQNVPIYTAVGSVDVDPGAARTARVTTYRDEEGNLIHLLAPTTREADTNE